MTSPVGGTAAVGTIDPTGAPADAAGAAARGSQQSLLAPQAFLRLVVPQLQYQDPTNPVDTSSFMNQTAMLSQVQTMTSMSSTLTSLASAQQAQAATSLIGKQITYADSSGAQVKGIVDSASILASGATLHVGATSVPLSSVLEVSQAPAAS